ncbi:DUF6894 family protein [Bosea sp. TAF32]|uniref:DUF6894 family protein n=1 Tax=Bosea sp. TAF32 TaxID=3237482 RepID=UPI003F8E69E1
MPRYFFHTRDGEKFDLDDEGTELPDEQSAYNAAKELLTAMNIEKLPNGDHISMAVTVQDAVGGEICVATLELHTNRP